MEFVLAFLTVTNSLTLVLLLRLVDAFKKVTEIVDRQIDIDYKNGITILKLLEVLKHGNEK